MMTVKRQNHIHQWNRLQRLARFVAEDAHVGSYQSSFRGRGLDFSDVRAYVPGDDIRYIHWRLTAKHGQPYVKLMREDHGFSLALLCDLGPGMFFSSHNRSKADVALELCAGLASIALARKDRVSLSASSVDEWVAKGGLSHRSQEFWRTLDSAQTFLNSREETFFDQKNSEKRNTPRNKQESDSFLVRWARARASGIPHGATLCVVSDFLNFGEQDLKCLSALSVRYRVMCLRVVDPREEHIPEGVRIPLAAGGDGDREKPVRFYVGSPRAHLDFSQRAEMFDQGLRKVIQGRAHAFYFKCSTERSLLHQVRQLLAHYQIWRRIHR